MYSVTEYRKEPIQRLCKDLSLSLGDVALLSSVAAYQNPDVLQTLWDFCKME